MVRFLIINGFSFLNKGDAAISICTFQSLRKNFPNSEIKISSITPEIDQKFYDKYNVQCVPQLFVKTRFTSSRYFNGLVVFLKMLQYLIISKTQFLPSKTDEKEIFRAFRDSDIIISQGGGYLGGYGNSIFALFHIYLAKSFGKKVYACAISVDPFLTRFQKFVSKFVLKKIDLITTREKNSFELLQSLGIKNVHFTADLAFLMENESSELGHRLLVQAGVPLNNELKIGITLRDWAFPTSKNPVLQKENYFSEMVSFISDIIKQKNCVVIIFLQSIFEPSNNDQIISQAIYDKIEKKENKVFLLKNNYTPGELRAMYGEMDFFIGTRMHSNIFALSMDVPTIAIGYQWKTRGIMNMLELTDFVMNIEEISKKKLDELMTKLLNDSKKVKENLKEKIPIIQVRAQKNFEYLKKFC